MWVQLPLPLWEEPRQPQLQGLDVTPYECGPVLARLRELQRWCGRPVPAALLADHLGKSERTARLYLRQLERAGYVQRPAGQRSGWAAS